MNPGAEVSADDTLSPISKIAAPAGIPVSRYQVPVGT